MGTKERKLYSWRWNVFWVWCSLFLAVTGYSQAYPVIPFFLEERYGLSSPETRNFYIGMIAFAGNLGFLIFSPACGGGTFSRIRKMEIRVARVSSPPPERNAV